MSAAIDTIQDEVARRRGVTIEQMVSGVRNTRVMGPRQEAMYLAHHLAAETHRDIGVAFGNRDHSTIGHGIRAVEGRMLADTEYANEMFAMKSEVADALATSRNPKTTSEISGSNFLHLAQDVGRALERMERAFRTATKPTGLPPAAAPAADGSAERLAALEVRIGAIEIRTDSADTIEEIVAKEVGRLESRVMAIAERPDPNDSFGERIRAIETSLKRLDERTKAPRPITLTPSAEPAPSPRAPTKAAPSTALTPARGASPALMAAARKAVADFDRLESDRFSKSERAAQVALDQSLKALKTTLEAERISR